MSIKKFLIGKFKIINLFLCTFVVLMLQYMNVKYTVWFQGPEAFDFYKYYYAIYDPVFSGGKWLAGILGALLIFPAHIFRKWLFYVSPPILLLTFYLVQGISVYSGNLLNPTRGKMAENGMFILAVVTALFVVVQLFLDWRKTKK